MRNIKFKGYKQNKVLLETYMNYVDVNLKKDFHNKTTGILLVRENNKWLIKYINNDGILVRNYITSDEQVSEYLGGLKWITIMK